MFCPGGFCLFSRGLYFLFCSLMNSLMRLHKQVYSRVSRIIDVVVFAREGAVKGKGELNNLTTRGLEICTECVTFSSKYINCFLKLFVRKRS